MKEIHAKGKSLPISTKHAAAICKFIKGKGIEEALSMLERVRAKRQAVPMEGEIPHRKGMMSGRFPTKASAYFIKLLKNLKGNASQQNLDAVIIKIAKADKAAKPMRVGRMGRAGKSTNVMLIGEAREELVKEKRVKVEKKEREGKKAETGEARETREVKEIEEEKKLRERPEHKLEEELETKEIRKEEKEPTEILRRKERYIEKEHKMKHKEK